MNAEGKSRLSQADTIERNKLTLDYYFALDFIPHACEIDTVG